MNYFYIRFTAIYLGINLDKLKNPSYTIYEI